MINSIKNFKFFDDNRPISDIDISKIDYPDFILDKFLKNRIRIKFLMSYEEDNADIILSSVIGQGDTVQMLLSNSDNRLDNEIKKEIENYDGDYYWSSTEQLTFVLNEDLFGIEFDITLLFSSSKILEEIKNNILIPLKLSL